ncbi:MAG: FAD-dependent monooxygenase [Halofilum sp. (in: g-proteobacteria)]
MAEPHASPDIVIVGGGPVGAALAIALADGTRAITVVEAQSAPPGGDTRATALSESSVRLLGALGAWPELAGDAVAIHTVEVSQRGHYGRTRLRAEDHGVRALGQVVAYDALARGLAARARSAPGVEWLAPASVADIDQHADGVRLGIDGPDGHTARRARLVVAADGTRSPLRARLGIGVREYDYGQTALLLPLETGGDPHTGYERFTAEGPMALLPAGGRRRTLIWTLPPGQAEAMAALAPEEIAGRVAARLGRSFGPVVPHGPPGAWSLRRVEAERGHAGRVALLGNAARTLHPVGAQGFNLALRDVCGLAAALDGARDPGDDAILGAWGRARQADRWRTRAFTDVLARGFVRGGGGLGAVRAGALLGLDTCSIARDGLAAQTMGLLGGLPRVGTWRLERRP